MGACCQVAEVHRRVTAAWRAPALGALLLMWVWPIVSLLYDALGGAGQGGDGQTPDIASGSDPEGCWQARCGRFVDARPTGTGAAQRVPI